MQRRWVVLEQAGLKHMEGGLLSVGGGCGVHGSYLGRLTDSIKVLSNGWLVA